MEHFLRSGSEAADAQIVPQHQDRHVHAAQQIDQIVIDLAQFQVPALHLRVDRVQFFV